MKNINPKVFPPHKVYVNQTQTVSQKEAELNLYKYVLDIPALRLNSVIVPFRKFNSKYPYLIFPIITDREESEITLHKRFDKTIPPYVLNWVEGLNKPA